MLQNVSIECSDVRLKVKGSKLTRIDLLLNKLEIILLNLKTDKEILGYVYDDTGNTREFVEKVKGIEEIKDVIEYYGKNFMLNLNNNKNKNAVKIILKEPIKKCCDEESQ